MGSSMMSHVLFYLLTFLWCQTAAHAQITFLEEPVNTTVLQDGRVSLRCVAVDAGMRRARVSWRKGVDEPLSNRFHFDPASGTLSLSVVHCDDSGWYSCVASDGSETVMKRAYLTVLCGTAPSFARALPSTYSFTNDHALEKSAVVHCYVRGSPPPGVSWEKEGQILPSSPSADGPYAVQGLLYLVSSQPRDSGMYCCVAKNRLGTAMKCTTVTILEETPPLWLSWWMVSLYCVVGLAVLLSVALCCRFAVEGYHRRKRELRKVQSYGEKPKTWDPMPFDPKTGKKVLCYVVDLKQASPEYKKVEQAFSRTMGVAGGQGIVKIQRIQNQKLYSQYIARKSFIDKTNPEGHKNEETLFHGCDGKVTNHINHEGFNRNFAGKNATALGRGVYFARDASYSAADTYTPRDANGHKHMYYARVLTGQYTKGNNTLLVPPPKDPSNPSVLHESVVDNVQNPRIFVVFQDAHVYPEYLITFQ